MNKIPQEYLGLRTSEDFGFSAVDETEVKQIVDENTLETTVIREVVSTSNEAVVRIEAKMDQILSLYSDGKLQLDIERKQMQEIVAGKLIELERLIIPLLINLMKNSEKEYIYWPNRKEKIQEQIDKVLSLTR